MKRAAKKHLSKSAEETESLGAELSRNFTGGEVVALRGDLGAGKTQFVRGMLRGLGGETRSVSSPTYVLLNIYASGRLKLYHLDAYRVRGSDDFESIGFTELLEQGGIIAVEWPERISALLPQKIWQVRLTAVAESHREIEITPPPAV